ncbi:MULTISPECIES: hypothetical protein [Pseudomonas chlororaphis group]|uniref:hypothetical protein n=1 Tax=Pseudomonas chlororaphis group TaxID=136842 RepID=UPI0020971007|nr:MULTISPECIES: hypothetical protein [Pseudomonas chlororaphis group]MCO7575316.1 hypothetical protein [Pseudomonas protegens]MCO7582581.1 hypothetical protein [Pseudomonas chlororaphis]MCO7599240.1 hypothetical protein [Pseudomonas chlororaphis]
MKTMIILALALLASASHAAAWAPGVRVVHDPNRHVTCWVVGPYEGTGISCLPDSSLNPRQDAATTGPGSEAVRVPEWIPMCHNEQLSTTTTPGDERFQL